MSAKRILEIGGLVAGVILVAFGIGALVMSVNARSTVGDELKLEQIVGSSDMNPTDIEESMQQAGLENVAVPSCDVAEQPIETGADARCFARYMRIHALESAGGLTYAQMGRYALASDPTDPKGTNDPTAAAKDEEGAPIANGKRDTWVTETALSTALNVSFMAEQIALFGVVVGIALLLSGIGFIVLALIVLGTAAREEAAVAQRVRTAPTTG